MLIPIVKGVLSYTADPVYQWDVNQPLEISGLDFTPTLHFCNRRCEKALVVNAEYNSAEKTATAIIPNYLLQDPYPVKAYVCQTEGDRAKTVYEIIIPILPRTQPDENILSV